MSQYQEMIDEPFQEPANNKDSIERMMSDSIPIELQRRKTFKNFYKRKTSDKLHSFVNWVELKKKLPQDKTVYDQIKSHYYEDLPLVVHHDDEVRCVAISGLNQMVAVGLRNGVVVLIESKTGKILKMFEADEANANCLILSAQYLFTGGNSSTVSMWTYPTNIHKEYTFEGHSNRILCLTITLYDTFLISGDADGVVFIWNIAEKHNRNFIAAKGFAINAIAVTPDASQIISAGDESKIKFWNFADLSLLKVFEDHKDKILAIAISPLGDRLASLSGESVVKIWDMKEMKEQFSLKGKEEINCLAFLPNGKAVALGTEDKSIMIWSVTKSKGVLKKSIAGHTAAIKCLAVDQTNALLISGSVDKTIRVLNLKQFKNTTVLDGSKAPVLALAAIPNTSYIISAGKENIIRVWSLENAKFKELNSNSLEVLSLDVNSQGTKFISGGNDGTITLWNIDHHNFLFTKVAISYKHLVGVSTLKFTRKGENIISGSLDQSLKIWDLTLLKEVRELKKHPGIISAMAITPDDAQIITGTKFSELYVWDFTTLKNVSNLKGHEGEITCIKVTSDYKLITGCQDCTIRIWNLKTMDFIKSVVHEKAVLSIEITPDNKEFWK